MSIITCNDKDLLIESGVLNKFLSKLTNPQFSSKHIKDNKISVHKETFKRIKNFLNIREQELYTSEEINDTCNYLDENPIIMSQMYLTKIETYRKNIYENILSSFDKYRQELIKSCKTGYGEPQPGFSLAGLTYDPNPIKDFSFLELTQYYLINDPKKYFDVVLTEQHQLVLQWIIYYASFDKKILSQIKLPRFKFHKCQITFQDKIYKYEGKTNCDEWTQHEYASDDNTCVMINVSISSFLHQPYICQITVFDKNGEDEYIFDDVMYYYGIANYLKDYQGVIHEFSFN
jgi:hypothetical protein